MADENADEHTKTVFAYFGAALYFAQVLEHGLVLALASLALIPEKLPRVRDKEEWSAVFDSFMDRQFKRTLGALLSDLRSLTPVPSQLDMLLGTALSKRNWLTHYYFRERAAEFTSNPGRERMIAELEEARALFEGAGTLLDSVVRPIRERYGITDERIERICNQMVRATD